MMRRTELMNPFHNVVPGEKATVTLPTDRRYHKIIFEYKTGTSRGSRATMEAAVKNIRVMLNGVPQWELSAKELFAILEIKGVTISSGIIPLNFSEPWRRTPNGEDATAWALQGKASSFQIEVELDAGASNPGIKCYAEYDNVDAPLLIKKFTRSQVQVSTTGILTVDQIPNLGDIHAMYGFEKEAGDIKSVKIERNGYVAYDLPRAIAGEALRTHGGAVVNDVFAVRFDRTERIGHFLKLTKQDGFSVPIKQEYDMAKANSFTQILEYLGAPN
ncbi:major capsid protein P2 [Pseudovibrio ascidiaceicola]|uniref:major capsid protein P2 n=1 Tax=Pseudovibrio ascidiaceicola TaxID=285279 RepID=UPI003D35FE7B